MTRCARGSRSGVDQHVDKWQRSGVRSKCGSELSQLGVQQRLRSGECKDTVTVLKLRGVTQGNNPKDEC